MYKSLFSKRVRYAEIDQMGYMYYGNYAMYYEIGRVEALRDLGVRYADLEKNEKIYLPVLSFEAKYIRPARYDDELTIETTIPVLPDDTIRFRSEIRNQQGELVNVGKVRLYFWDATNEKRIQVPKIILDKLAPYYNGSK